MGYVDAPRGLSWQATAAAIGVDEDKLRQDTRNYHAEHSLKEMPPADSTPEDLDLSAFSSVWKFLKSPNITLWLNEPICPPCLREQIKQIELLPEPEKQPAKITEGLPQDEGIRDISAPKDILQADKRDSETKKASKPAVKKTAQPPRPATPPAQDNQDGKMTAPVQPVKKGLRSL